MPSGEIVVSDEDDQHVLIISHRDFGLLRGPRFDEGRAFIKSLGMFENFTVAGGIPADSFTMKHGSDLHESATKLLQAVERDIDLLSYDYSYGFAKDRARNGGAQSLPVGDQIWFISTKPAGYCHLEISKKNDEGNVETIDWIDLRVVKKIENDNIGSLTAYRRKAKTDWPTILPPYIEFLSGKLEEMLKVENRVP